MFGREGGAFPVSLSCGKNRIFSSEEPALHLKLSDGRILHPFLPKGFTPLKKRIDSEDILQFDRVPFIDEEGKDFEKLFLSQRYEFTGDGIVFAQTSLVFEDYALDAPDIVSCSLSFALDFSSFANVAVPYGASPDLASCSGMGSIEGVFPGIRRTFNFSYEREDGRGGYFELFMEGPKGILSSDTDSSLAENCESSIMQSGSMSIISWEFLKKPVKLSRNMDFRMLIKWGCLAAESPVSRRNPPLRLYHWIECFEERIPTRECIRLLAAAGADALILHEQWRCDVSGIAFPWDAQKLRECIDEAHKNNIRIVLYVRGHNETTIDNDEGAFFDIYLKKDFDGLYADFGGAWNCVNPDFKKFYLKWKSLRKRVGKYGLLYSHTGGLFSGVGLTPGIIDGYVFGEGENGSVTRDSFTHKNLSGAMLTTGSFWTAAFPHYGAERTVAFMASAGQYPHVPLGRQFLESSLAHPTCPGINDLYLRPLWKLYGILKGTRDLEIYNEFNSSGIIENPDRNANGVYLVLDRDKELALLVISDLSGKASECKITVNWDKLSFSLKRKTLYLLEPEKNSPGKAVPSSPRKVFSFSLAPYQCIGFLLGEGAKEDVSERLGEYEKPYCALSSEAEEYLCVLSEQKRIRENLGFPAKNYYVRLTLPQPPIPCVCNRSFYAMTHEVGIDRNGSFISLGYITREGFTNTLPPQSELLKPCETTPWINVRKFLREEGPVLLGIRSYWQNGPKCIPYFHSLINIDVSPTPKDPGSTTCFHFMNEVEVDRSILHFRVNLTSKTTKNRINSN